MGSVEEHEGWSSASFTCPVCKQQVPAVATKRRKVFGAYVPVWEPGPCENPDCPLNAEPPSPGSDDEREDDVTDGPKEPQRG
ncbi:hypothetical protein [Streptomyces sp. 8N616]|uniref:hypothetical protein n=1 Tax=Streptomyces sp. 8N616 TaxID=3457414 RepID=UPI003FCF4B45